MTRTPLQTYILLALVTLIPACTPPDRAGEGADGTEEVQANILPSFDCDDPQSGAEEIVCADEGLATLDLRLDSVFGRALDRAAGLEAGAEAAVAELRAYQRGWIKGRDDCWKAEDERDCIQWAYRQRTAELVADFSLQEPEAVDFWFCDDNPANEFVATRFATDPPSLRLERGDRTSVAVAVPSASGVRYEGPFGRWIWIHGTEATVSWPEGTTWSCRLRTPTG